MVAPDGNPATVHPAYRCQSCGLTSRSDIGFVTVKSYLKRRAVSLCPICQVHRLPGRFVRQVAWLILFPVLGFLLITFTPPDETGWLLINAWVIFLLEVLLVLPHELGHALTARLVGLPVTAIQVGSGRTVFQGSLLGIPVAIHLLPWGGVTWVRPFTDPSLRVKYALVLAGGPAVNATLVGVTFLIFGADHLLAVKPWKAFTPALDFAITNALVFLWSMFPLRITTARGISVSDGRNFLEVLFSPNGLTSKLLLASSKGRLGDYEAARQILLPLVELKSEDPWMQTSLKNSVAWYDFMTGRTELLEEANQHSREALEAKPGVSHYKGTRGAILIQMGNLDEGIDLVMNALRENWDAESRALNACCIAMARTRQNRMEEAKEFLDLARRLDPLCPLLPRATALLA